MSKQNPTKLSRRDTIKILAAAAGASALVNIPSKWTKPGMDFGLLPAHAQTSQVIHTLLAGADAPIAININQTPITINSTVQLTPATPGIAMHYSIVLHETNTTVRPAGIDTPLTGTAITNEMGTGIAPITYSNLGPNATITVNWSFENPSDGTGTDEQIFKTPTLHTLQAGPDSEIQDNVEQPPITIESTVQITPADPDIVMRYSIVLFEPQGLIHPTGITLPDPLTGTVVTDNTGLGTIPITYSNLWFDSSITVTWTFENPSDGMGTDDQVFRTPEFPK